MTYTRQGRDEIMIAASASRIWEILEDPLLIPRWNPMVRKVSVPDGQHEHEGAVRKCEVEFGSRKGRVTEKCVEFQANRKLMHVLEADTLGMDRMLSDFAFSANLSPAGDGGTLLRLETYYRPKGALARVMNFLLMRPSFGKTRRLMLKGLKNLCEAAAQRPSPVDEVPQKPLNRAPSWG